MSGRAGRSSRERALPRDLGPSASRPTLPAPPSTTARAGGPSALGNPRGPTFDAPRTRLAPPIVHPEPNRSSNVQLPSFGSIFNQTRAPQSADAAPVELPPLLQAATEKRPRESLDSDGVPRRVPGEARTGKRPRPATPDASSANRQSDFAFFGGQFEGESRFSATQKPTAPIDHRALEMDFAGAQFEEDTAIARTLSLAVAGPGEASSARAEPASWNQSLAPKRPYGGHFPRARLVVDLFKKMKAERGISDADIDATVQEWAAAQTQTPSESARYRLTTRLKTLKAGFEHPEFAHARAMKDFEGSKETSDLHLYVITEALGTRSPDQLDDVYREFGIQVERKRKVHIKANVGPSDPTDPSQVTLGQIYRRFQSDDRPGAIAILKDIGIKKDFEKWFDARKPLYEPLDANKPVDSALRKQILAKGMSYSLEFMARNDLAADRIETIVLMENTAVDNTVRQLNAGVPKEELSTKDIRATSLDRVVEKARWLISGDDAGHVQTLKDANLENKGPWSSAASDAIVRIMAARRTAHQPHAISDIETALDIKIAESKKDALRRRLRLAHHDLDQIVSDLDGAASRN